MKKPIEMKIINAVDFSQTTEAEFKALFGERGESIITMCIGEPGSNDFRILLLMRDKEGNPISGVMWKKETAINLVDRIKACLLASEDPKGNA